MNQRNFGKHISDLKNEVGTFLILPSSDWRIVDHLEIQLKIYFSIWAIPMVWPSGSLNQAALIGPFTAIPFSSVLRPGKS